MSFFFYFLSDFPTKKPIYKKSKTFKKVDNKSKYHSKKTVENQPRSILSFPQNLPVHLPYLNGTVLKSNFTTVTSTAAPIDITNITAETTLKPTTTTQNILSLNVSVNSTNCCDLSNSDKTAINALENNKIEMGNEKVATTNPPDEKNVLYEKTIVNENGLFIENIRKITEINENSLSNESSKENVLDERNEDEPKQIKIDDISSGQHYVITASGNVENEDVLASDSVLLQFKNNFPDFPIADSSNNSSSLGNDKNITSTTETVITTTDLTSTLETSSSNLERNCIVMGKLYTQYVSNHIYMSLWQLKSVAISQPQLSPPI